MTWVRIDDRAATHPKLRDVGPEAAWLWVCGLCWCNGHHTDGVIRRADLMALSPNTWTPRELTRLAGVLVRAGLWLEHGVNHVVHDYAQYQEEALRENVDERRKYERDRKRALRAAKKTAQNGPAPPVSRRDSPGHVPGTVQGTPMGTRAGRVPPNGIGTNATESHVSQPPGPARPDPSPPDPTEDPLARAEHLLRLARAELIHIYQARYEAETGEPWMSLSHATTAVDTCARVVLAKGEALIGARAKAMLEHAFADEWMRANRWPWAAIAKDPARYLVPPPPRAPRNGKVDTRLRAAPGEFGEGDFSDDDIPADGPQKVIGYG